MKPTTQTRARFAPASEPDRELVRQELAEILRSVHFTHSKRYPALLSYVVEKTLGGDAADLKERTLGVDVFRRRPDYDNNDDTIVRVTAGEVRKRLALVYHESDIDRPVQIELPPGSYVPEFFRVLPEESAPVLAEPQAMSEVVPEIAIPVDPPPGRAPRTILPRLAAAVAFAVLAGVGARWYLLQQDSVRRFWQPVKATSTPVILCVGGMVPNTESQMTTAKKAEPYPYISISTADALSGLAATLALQKIPYFIQPTSSTSLTDLREHPVVLVGAYNNDWSWRIANGLRYRFSDESDKRIYDSANPSTVWARSPQIPYKDADDFAIVARFRDKLTENFVVIAGGIGKNGTEAAAQFVTSSRYLDLLDRPQSKDWASKNVELVLRTRVIDGRAGPPTIEAIYLW